MLDIGWTELLVIAIVLIVVVGPKDLPPMLRAFGKMTSNLRKMAGDFRTQFDEALREADMDDVRQTISDAKSLNPANALRDAINPLRQMGQEIRNDLQKATAVPSAADNATKSDDPLLTGSEADGSTIAVEPAATAATGTAAAVGQASIGGTETMAKATVPETLSAAPDVPARRPRAPRKTTLIDPSASVEPKSAVEKTGPARAAKPKAGATKSAAVAVEPVVKVPKTTRAAKKAAAPKDEA